MLSAAPWFRFFPADWLSDSKVRALDPAARGHLVDLWSFAWREGKLPDDAEQIARMLGADPENFADVWPQLRAFFVVNGAGDLHSARQQVERNRYERLSKAGKKGRRKQLQTKPPTGQARTTPGPPPGQARATPGDTDAEVETEGGDVDDDGNVIPSSSRLQNHLGSFDTFWEAYPRREGSNPRRAAAKRFEALAKTAPPQTIINAATRYRAECKRMGKIGTEYVMRAATFLGPSGAWEEYAQTTKPAEPPGPTPVHYVCPVCAEHSTDLNPTPGRQPDCPKCQHELPPFSAEP